MSLRAGSLFDLKTVSQGLTLAELGCQRPSGYNYLTYIDEVVVGSGTCGLTSSRIWVGLGIEDKALT